MHVQQPTHRTLFLAWLALMILTIATMLAGRVDMNVTLGIAFMAALGFITLFKAKFILRYYLNLRAASAGWRTAFTAFLILLVSTIVGIYALAGVLNS